jgi:hypothetical protein
VGYEGYGWGIGVGWGGWGRVDEDPFHTILVCSELVVPFDLQGFP